MVCAWILYKEVRTHHIVNATRASRESNQCCAFWTKRGALLEFCRQLLLVITKSRSCRVEGISSIHGTLVNLNVVMTRDRIKFCLNFRCGLEVNSIMSDALRHSKIEIVPSTPTLRSPFFQGYQKDFQVCLWVCVCVCVYVDEVFSVLKRLPFSFFYTL